MSNHFRLDFNLCKSLSQKRIEIIPNSHIRPFSTYSHIKIISCSTHPKFNLPQFIYALSEFLSYSTGPPNHIIPYLTLPPINCSLVKTRNDLSENFPIVHSNDRADHLREDDHVPQVGLHHVRLLVHLQRKSSRLIQLQKP